MPAAGTAQRGTKTPNPRDHTGVVKAKLEAEHAAEIEERAAEMAVAAEVASARRATEVVDYTKGGTKGPAQAQPTKGGRISPELAAEIEQATEVEVGPKDVEIRVKFKIEDMVFGRQVVSEGEYDPDTGALIKLPVHGNLNFYSFDEGVRYRVPVDLAKHLDELGYLYH